MAEKRTIELEIKDNANSTQQQFENLRQQIAKTTQEVDELTQSYGENSQEVTAAKNKLTELTTSYTNLNKVATDTGATFADVYGEMQPLTTRMGEAEDRLYELAAAGKTASKEYQELLQTTQNYLRIQQSVDLQVEAGAVPAAQKMTMAVGGVAGAFGVAEGAAALFGVESQKLQETMVKLQAAMTITQGLTTIREAIPTFQAMGNAAKQALSGIRTGIAATGIGLLIVGVGLLIANFDKLKSAMTAQTAAQKVSNQVTAQATAAIANEISAADKLSKQLKTETLTRGEKLQKVKEFQAAYPGLLKNVNLETMSIAQINSQLEKNIQLLRLQAEVKAIEAIRAEKLQNKIKTQLDELAERQENATNWTVNLGESAENGWVGFSSAAENASLAQKKFNDIQTVGTKKIDKDISMLDQQSLSVEKQIAALQKQGAQVGDNNSGVQDFSKNVASFTTATNTNTSAIDKQREALDKQREALEKLKDLQDRIAQAEDEYLTSLLSQQEQEKKAVREKYEALIIEGDKYNQDTLLLREALDKGLADVDKKYADLAAEEKKKNEDAKLAAEKEAIEKANTEFEKGLSNRFQAELLMANEQQKELLNQRKSYQDQLDKLNELYANGAIASQEEYNLALQNLEEDNQKKTDSIKKKYDDKDIARKNELRQKTLDLTSKSFSALAELAGSFNTKNEKDARKQFQVQKAFNLAAAITNTAMAVTGALTAGGNPIKLAKGINFVEAGIAATIGAANIIKISNSKFGGGGSGGGGNDTNVPTTAPMTANFNTIGSSGINQLAQLQQTPTQAYVVSGEVTSAQALDRNRVQNATL
jgi:hypothetical protein